MRSPKPVRLGTGRFSFEVHPVELYTYAITVVSVLAMRSWGLRADWVTVDYIFRPMVKAIPQILAMGIVLQLLYRTLYALLLKKRSYFTDYLRSLGRWQCGGSCGFGSWLPTWCVNYVYFWIKVIVPLINHRLYDSQLWNLERFIHLGLSPNVLAVELFKDSFALPVLDYWYGLWIQTIFLMITFFAAASEPRLRRSFLLSCSLLWTIGSWIYMAVPALGPLYFSSDIFAEVWPSMPMVESSRELLANNYELMIAGRDGSLKEFNPTRGVAALPSLHVAGHFMMACWARSYARPVFVLFASPALS